MTRFKKFVQQSNLLCKARVRVQAPNCSGFGWLLYVIGFAHVVNASLCAYRRVWRIHFTGGCNFVYAAGGCGCGCAGAGTAMGTGAPPALALAVLSFEVAFVLALSYLVPCFAC